MVNQLICCHRIIRKGWLFVNNVLFCVSSFFISFIEVYVWSVFYDKKINFKNFYLYFGLLLMCGIGLINYIFVSAFVRMLFNMIIFFVSNYLIFKKKLNEIIVNILYSQFLLTLADVLYSLILMLIFNMSVSTIASDRFVTSIGNICVAIIFLIICKFSIFKCFYNKLIYLTNKIKMIYLIFICVFVMISINFLMATVYYDLKPSLIVLINTVLILVYSFIVYKSLSEKNNSDIIKAENISLLESLNQYEDMVDRQRVDNHENKNQLLIIKSMIKKNDKDVIKYIDTIVKDEKEDDEELYTKVKTIPSGGLQGIIYQKMLTMKDERISFNLNVSRDVRKIELDDFSMEDNYRLCKVIGVLLDNAIEESRNIDDKCIIISLFVDDNFLVVEISNKFNGIVDMDRIDDEGYTTKGDGHGYGLSLVKKILSETSRFVNERCIKKNLFKQIIKIKIKNT